MPLFKRPDGTVATDVPAYRRIMPFIMPTRTESQVFFEQELDLTRALPFIEAWNAREPELRITVFHLFLWAALRGLGERPRLNRFVSGGRIWQRDGIWISYSAKKALRDDAPMVVIKRRFSPQLSFGELVAFISLDLDEGRSKKKSHVDKELSFFLRLPGPLLRLGVRLVRLLDSWNLLPASFIRPDPMFCSLFIANLGSVRLQSPFHHLYEYGNCPFFAALGRANLVPVALSDGRVETRKVCSVKYTFDERIEDGLYCATGLEKVKLIMEDPEGHGAGS